MAIANAINLPYGAAGQIVTPSGGAAPSSIGGKVLLNTYTASSSASIDITSQIVPTYNAYEIVISKLRPGTSQALLRMQYSVDNGATWDSAAGHYSWFTMISANTNAGSSSDTAKGVAPSMASSSITNFIVLNIVAPGVGKVYSWQQGYVSGLTTGVFVGAGDHIFGTPINAIRFLMTGGNISTGTFKIYGYTA